MKREVLEKLVAAKAAKRAVVLLTWLRSGEARVWAPGEEGEISGELRDAAARALRTDDAFTVETADGAVFVKPVNPPLRLFVVGAVHIADPLARMAALLGYEVTVIDPRAAFARAERWPGVTVKNEWPDEALRDARIDHRTAIVALTHDPKVDDPALEAALRSDAFYVGALGSGKTHASRLRRLSGLGLSEQQLARIHGPVGLRIGARSPGEIAVSILAQMTEVLRRGAA
jgi:xanthine dehydrogenase accessory factor